MPREGPATDRAQRYRLVPTAKRVRARIAGTFIADSTAARLLFERPYAHAYAFPRADVREDLLVPGRTEAGPHGPVRHYDLEVEGRTIPDAVQHHEAPDGDPTLADLLVLDWGKMDAWYEEDEEVFVHPQDPHHRIDVRQSSRHVIIEYEGERLAESRRPRLLFETNLPVRYYLPQTDVRLDLLRPSEKTSGCAYKGFAEYYHVQVGDKMLKDTVWVYRSPHPDAHQVQGHMAFFDERVDVLVDGRRQERPATEWA